MEVDNPSTIQSNESKKVNQTRADASIGDDLSMSDLEMLANEAKVKNNSANFEIDVDDIKSNKSSKKSSVKAKKNVSEKSSPLLKKKTQYKKSYSSSNSSDSSSRINRNNIKKVTKENKDPDIYREKATFLYKISVINQKKGSVVSHIKLDINNSLDEIKSEFNRIKSTLENEKMVKFCKQMLLMGVQGVEMLNTRFDPMGIDLDGWSESMGYSMEQQEYDDVLSELYEKYKGKGQMSPELKLVLMICGSAAMFAVTKKLTKVDSGNDNMFNNILSSFMGSQQQSPSKQQQPPQQQFRQPPQQQPPQQQFRQPPQQQQFPQQFQDQFQPQPLQQQFQQQFQDQFQNLSAGTPPLGVFIPSVTNLRDQNQNNDNISEASSNVPSKIRGPNGNFDSPDSIDLQNIIKTMNDKKKQKETTNILNETDLFSIDEKEIKPKTVKKTRAKRGVSAKV